MLICPKCGNINCHSLTVGEFNQDEVGCQNSDCYYRGTVAEFSPKEYLVSYQGEVIARISDFGKGFIDFVYGGNAEMDVEEVTTS